MGNNKFTRSFVCGHCKHQVTVNMGMDDTTFICPNCGNECHVQSMFEKSRNKNKQYIHNLCIGHNVSRGNQQRNKMIGIITILILIFLCSTTVNYFHHKIPDITEMNLEEGINKIQSMNNNYDIVTKEEFNNNIEKGYVIRTIPEKGKIAHDNDTIEIVVSRGEAIKIPDLTNYSPDDATNVIQELLLNPETIYENSDTIEKGKIIKSIPEHDTDVERNSTVKIVVSKGKAVKIPDLTNTAYELAVQILNDLTLTIANEEYAYSEDVAKDSIISIKPEQGTVVDEGTAVDIVISKGVIPTMPDIIGMSTEDGVNLLKELGIEVTEDEVFDKQETTGKIIRCNVDAGEKLLDGKVTVISSKGSKYNITKSDGITYATANDIVYMYKHDESELVNYDLDNTEVCITGKVKSYSMSTYISEPVYGDYRTYYINFVSDDLSLDNDDMESWFGISVNMDASTDESSLKSAVWNISVAEGKMYADTDYYVGTTFSMWVKKQQDNGNWRDHCTVRVYGTGDMGTSTYSVDDCYKVELLNDNGKVISTWKK